MLKKAWKRKLLLYKLNETDCIKSFRTKKPGQTTSAERFKKCTKEALPERPGIRERKTGRKLRQAVTNLFCQEDIIMKKKVLAVLLGGCMVVGMLAGCGSKGGETKTTDEGNKTEGSGDSKGYHFEVVVKSFQSSYWQAAVQGINQACDELGVTANTTGPNAESDIADQVNMLNNAINKDPDGIALAACDQNSVIDSLKSALEKKIPVVCFDSGVPDAPEGSVYATVVTDNEQAGGIAAEHIYPAIKDRLGKGQVRVGRTVLPMFRSQIKMPMEGILCIKVDTSAFKIRIKFFLRFPILRIELMNVVIRYVKWLYISFRVHYSGFPFSDRNVQ